MGSLEGTHVPVFSAKPDALKAAARPGYPKAGEGAAAPLTGRFLPVSARQTFTVDSGSDSSGRFSNEITAFKGILRVTFLGSFEIAGR